MSVYREQHTSKMCSRTECVGREGISLYGDVSSCTEQRRIVGLICERLIGKGTEGNGPHLVEVLSPYLRHGTEKHYNNSQSG
jgi:hypothetical protein